MAGRTVERATGSGETVCVTGAGGCISSWLVKLLLSRGYTVHGTVRDLSDWKTAHLKQLENASEKLKLFKADLLDYDGMAAAIAGCQGVFHVATPVPSGKITDPEQQMLGPAVDGTTNVLKAASAANVRRVVVVSSIVAVEINPKDWPKDKIKDESCWSDKEFCRNNENWYFVAKITSEEFALEYGRRTGLDVVTINPAVVLGPLLQPTLNASCQFLVYFLKGGPDQLRNKLWHIVDVRDTADALLLVYELPEASGRHICAPHFISARDFLDLLKSMYTEYPFVNNIGHSENLKLFRAGLLDYGAMVAAVAGCQRVFHVATPVPSGNLTDPEREMLGPAVTGTRNVLDAALAAKVRRVVVVSSMVTVEINPKDWPKDKIKDENCWSDKEFCRNNEDWYSVAKITSEEVALEYGRQIGLDVVTINPALVLGPLLQPICNTSCQFLIYFLKGPDRMRNKLWHIVDVRDVADALLLIYEVPEASGRYICAPHFIGARDLLSLLKNMYPDYPCIAEESISDMDNDAPMTSDKLKRLGWSCGSLEETIADTIEFCKEDGFLDDMEGELFRFPPLYNKI